MNGDQNTLKQDGQAAKQKFYDDLLKVLIFLFAIWTLKIIEVMAGLNLTEWGLQPQTGRGLIGILTMPFLHGDFEHLHGNSFGVLCLGLAIFHFHEKLAWKVMVHIWLWGGLLVWLFARPSFHVGASGMIYGLSAFLFLSGVIRRDRSSLGAAMIVAFLFGGSVWGIFPFQRGISWEGHLFGALVGSYLALLYRFENLPADPPDEEESEETHFPVYGSFQD